VYPCGGEGIYHDTTTKEECVSAKNQKRNTQPLNAVNEAASATLQQRSPEPQLSLQHMERTLRWMDEQLRGLRTLIRLMLTLARGVPEEIRAQGLPEGCPGWGNYSTKLTTCALCRWNFHCMTASDEGTEPSRD
jgi:hypothetical protein